MYTWFPLVFSLVFLTQNISTEKIISPSVAPPHTLPPREQEFDKATALRNRGDVQQAAALFEKLSQEAEKTDFDFAAKASLGAAACNIRLFKYREALTDSQQADHLAELANDPIVSGAAAGNEASIYFELGDYHSAHNAARRSVSLLSNSPRKIYLAQALITAGDAEFQLKHIPAAISLLRRATSVAHEANLPIVEGIAQGHLGTVLLAMGDYPEARAALLEAVRLFASDGKHAEYVIGATQDLAEYYMATKDYSNALLSVDKVLRARTSLIPRCWPLQVQGRALLALGKPYQALKAFDQAITAADDWRAGMLLADETASRTAVSLASVYADYVETAASLGLRNHNEDLIEKAFDVLIASRGWNLRTQFLYALQTTLKIPPHYYELLSEFQEVQGEITLERGNRDLSPEYEHLDQIKSALSDMENQMGVTADSLKVTAPPAHTRLLEGVRKKIDSSEMLLVLYTSPQTAFLWAVTKDELHLYRIPNPNMIAIYGKEWSNLVKAETGEHSYSITPPGRKLSDLLLSQLPESLLAKPNWLIDANGALNGVPFAAFPLPRRNERLVQSHTFRVIPSIALLANPTSANQDHPVFVGVSDPIYNTADPRAATLPHVVRNPRFLSLARLVGTYREVVAAARVLRYPDTQILSGKQATIASLQDTIDHHPPSVLHFSVHVIAPEKVTNTEDPSGQAALALTLAPNGVPELLTREMVVTFRVPGAVVVMNGCHSQQGEVLPSGAIINLSRAWLIAGAVAVIVTDWEIPDDNGDFFVRFYQAFQNAKGTTGQKTAFALQQAQLHTQEEPSWAGPARWATYSLVSRE